MTTLQTLAMVLGFGSLTAVGVVYLLIRYRERAREQSAGRPREWPAQRADRYRGNGAENVVRLLRDAGVNLRKGGAFRNRGIRDMPVYLVIGEQGSGKTSLVLNSGHPVLLLAGQNKPGLPITRTDTLNIWLVAKSVVVIDVPAHIWRDSAAALALTRALRHLAWKVIPGKRKTAPRAVIACLPAGLLEVERELSETLGAMHGFLLQAAEQLGSALPVYAVFTRADGDGIEGFDNFFANLTNDEAQEVLGASLDSDQLSDPALYENVAMNAVDIECGRLAEFLQTKRTSLLTREIDAACAWKAFEFPRQLEQLKDSIGFALRELCKPDLQDTNPVLRGFYFTGVRQRPRQQEWILSYRLLRDVVFADEAAGTASTRRRLRNRYLNVLCWIGSAAGLILIAGLVTSYLKNASLERSLRNGAAAVQRRLAPQGDAGGQAPGALEELSRYSEPVDRLVEYRRETPFSLRWGLYQGGTLFPPAKRQFCSALKSSLIDAEARAMGMQLQHAKSGDPYEPIYGALKAELMMSSYPQYADPEFLSQELTRQAGAPNGREAAIQRTVNTYAELLRTPEEMDSCLVSADPAAIRNARTVLRDASADDRIYADLKARAAKGLSRVDYNRLHPNEAVRDDFAVPGEFTAAGWTRMQSLLDRPGNIMGTEEWVLGSAAGSQPSKAQDPIAVSARLRTRYQDDYIAGWRLYLNQAAVARYANVNDASRKLEFLSSGRALAWLFSIATENTNVTAPVSDIFQSVHDVVTKPGDFTPNMPYLQSLAKIRTLLENELQETGPARDRTLEQVRNEASQTQTAVATAAIRHPGDVGDRVRDLLLQPLVQIDPLLRSQDAAELTSAGAGMCGPYNSMYAKFPFRRDAKTSAGRDEALRLLNPSEGPVWTLYSGSLTDSLDLGPLGFSQKLSNPKTILRKDFLAFINRVWLHSRIFYGTQDDPGVRLTLRLVPAGSVREVEITVDDDQRYVMTPGSTAVVNWSLQRSSSLSVKAQFPGIQVPAQTANDPWAIFLWLDTAVNPSSQPLEWFLRWGSLDRADTGSAPSYKMEVRFADGTPFDARKLTGLPCVPPVAK